MRREQTGELLATGRDLRVCGFLPLSERSQLLARAVALSREFPQHPIRFGNRALGRAQLVPRLGAKFLAAGNLVTQALDAFPKRIELLLVGSRQWNGDQGKRSDRKPQPEQHQAEALPWFATAFAAASTADWSPR